MNARNYFLRLNLAFAFVFSFLCAGAATFNQYLLRDLGPTGAVTGRGMAINNAAVAWDINNSGTIVGTDWQWSIDFRKPYVVTNGQFSYLGLPPAVWGADALAINDQGNIVGGGWDDEDGGYDSQFAIMWVNGSAT